MRERILIVEDNTDTREMLAALLSFEGYSVVEAANGRAGYNSARESSPDLIITDISMPDMDGVEMIGRVRTEIGLNVPIIALTAFPSEHQDRARMAGADEAIAKPIDADLLVAKVKRMLTPMSRAVD